MSQNTALTALLAALVGGFAGFFAGRSAAPAPLPTPGDDPSPHMEAMLTELRALRADLVAHAPAKSANADAGAPERETIAQPATHDEQLLAELRDLRARVDQIGNARAAESGVLRRMARNRPRDEASLANLARIKNENWDGAQQEVFLLTAADLLQRYGKPDRASPTKAGVRWEYEFGAADDRQWIGLTLVDGVVISVQ